jgi:hypothetical protein
MYADELLELSALGEQNLNQASLIDTQPVQAESDGPKPDVAAIPDGALYLLPLCMVTVWVITLLTISSFWKIAREGLLTAKHLHQVPCRNCRFFESNPYLKCAVHPSLALTEQAFNCSDYCPQNKHC